MNLCVNCKHYIPDGQCGHPELVSPVDGSPVDCFVQRDGNLDVHPHYCGRAGQHWEAAPAYQSPALLGAAQPAGTQAPPAPK